MTASKTADARGNPEEPWAYEKVHVSREGSVLFAEIAAPPMNLEGPELVRDLVSLIQRAEAAKAKVRLQSLSPFLAAISRLEALLCITLRRWQLRRHYSCGFPYAHRS